MLKQAATILAALLIATVLAVGIVSYLHPMTATVISVSIMRTLDGTVLADDAPIDWGMVEPNASIQFDNLTATNTGNVNCTVILTHDAPENWTITWACNETLLMPTNSCYAPLVLYVPIEAVGNQTYSWNCWVTATEP